MRFKLSLSVDPKNNVLPINYQYEISSWIYKTLYSGDSDFSSWLHQQGYQLENKKFKLFTFSNIQISPPWKRIGDRIKIFSDRASIELSFCVKEAIEYFITGLFQQQYFTIGDRKSQAGFEIQSIERIPDPLFSTKMTFRSLSPICLSRTIPDKKTPLYLAPDDPDYATSLFDNLLYKYIAANSPEISFSELKERENDEQAMQWELLDTAKSRLVKIKANTAAETFLRGYMYSFAISAPARLIEFGFHAGFGEKNSMGFGCVDLLKKKNGK